MVCQCWCNKMSAHDGAEWKCLEERRKKGKAGVAIHKSFLSSVYHAKLYLCISLTLYKNNLKQTSKMTTLSSAGWSCASRAQNQQYNEKCQITKGLKFSATLCSTWKLITVRKPVFFLYNPSQNFPSLERLSSHLRTWSSPPALGGGGTLNLITKPFPMIGSYPTAKPTTETKTQLDSVGYEVPCPQPPFQMAEHQQMARTCLITLRNSVAVCADFLICNDSDKTCSKEQWLKPEYTQTQTVVFIITNIWHRTLFPTSLTLLMNASWELQ